MSGIQSPFVFVITVIRTEREQTTFRVAGVYAHMYQAESVARALRLDNNANVIIGKHLLAGAFETPSGRRAAAMLGDGPLARDIDASALRRADSSNA